MPYSIRKLPNQDLYRVYNTKTKEVHSYGTTLENAKKQVKLLHMVDAGVPLKKQGGEIYQSDIKIAKEIRPITKEDAMKDYDNLVAINPKPSDLNKITGNKFVDYYMFPYRLNTGCNRYKGINFFEFYKNPSKYLTENKNKVYNNFVKEQMSKGIPEDKASYIFFGHWICSVAIFKPIIAKYLYQQYNPHTILDITMGWGGRLAAAMSIPNVKYIGFDTNTDLKKPYDEMVRDLGVKDRVKLFFKDSAKADLSKFKYDMVFTSPPYFIKGSDKSVEGYINMPYYNSYDDWAERFFYPVMSNAWNNMEVGGTFCINTNFTDYELLRNLFGSPDRKINIRNRAPHRSAKEIADKDKAIVKSTEFIYIWKKKSPAIISMKKKGGSIETDRFERHNIVSLPEFKSVKIELPTYMYKRIPDVVKKDGTTIPPPYRYRLVIPITSSRNLSSRLTEKSVEIQRKPISQPFTYYEESDELPTIDEFSPEDRDKIEEYYAEVAKNEKKDRDEIENDYYEVIPRGYPLPCDDPGPKNPKAIKVQKERKLKEELKENKPRGRPKQVRKVELQGEEEDDLFAPLTEASVSSRTPSVASKSKSSQKSLSELSSLSSLAKESSVSSRKSSKKAPSVSSESSISTAKSSKSSKSADTINTGDMSLGSEDIDDFLKKYGIKGKGITNNISTNNNKMANSWVQYVKEYASKNGMSYRDALRDPKCKAGYKKGGAMVKRGMGVIDEMGDQDLIADTYNSSQLGANAGKKYISL